MASPLALIPALTTAPKRLAEAAGSFWREHSAACALLLLALLLCGAPVFGQSGAQTAQAGLDTLVHRADTIVRGSVVSATMEPHPQFPNIQTVVVTVTVAKVLKGSAPASYTFRQFVWETKDTSNAWGYRKAGQLLLFLNPVSPYGLTSPVGLEQGRFQIRRDAKGKILAMNGRGNVGLFQEVASRAASRGVAFSARAQAILSKPSGQVSLEGLEDAISALAGADK